MRTLALALLLLLAAAGCSGKSDPTDTADTGTSTGTQSGPTGQDPGTAPSADPAAGPRIVLKECKNFGAVFPVPDAAAQALIPEGFRTVPAAGPPAGATLYVMVVNCQEASFGGVSVGDATFVYEELAVVPDDAHKVAGISDYTIPVMVAVNPEALADAMEARAWAAPPGRSTSWTDLSEGTLSGGGSAKGDGFTLTAHAAGSPTALPSGSFVVFGVKDRQVVTTTVGTSEGGQALSAAALLQVEGSPPLLEQATPAARGFSVSGFALTFTPRS
ncbi:MAG TPA: hypothetical protein VM286_01055 [Candidatus Thermoplasmatota archaeon]|nr:hypothetical protein [Candidatus Thermoplasmatota archaeon]